MIRTDRSGFGAWWWTIDRVALFAMLALIAIGLMLAFAASPAATGSAFAAGDFHYAGKQIGFAVIAAGIVAFISLLNLRAIKQVAALVFGLALIGCVFVLFTAEDVLGSRRWIDLGFTTLQPSEFLKPGFAVLAAAILADKAKMVVRKELITLILVAPALLLLMLQPDVGQTGLLLALWGALLFFYGIPLAWIGALAGSGVALIGFAYLTLGHVRHRIDQFLDPSQMGFQAKLSLKAFAHGGLTGVGPGAGTVKYKLPYAHSDFVFAVAGEEFGLVLCGLIAVLFCVLSVRLLMRSARLSDPFAQMAGAGLAIVVALQAFINMAVAVSLMPAKGMTLPFISYGGSSLFAVAVTMGFALAVTRQRSRIGEQSSTVFAFLREARA